MERDGHISASRREAAERNRCLVPRRIQRNLVHATVSSAVLQVEQAYMIPTRPRTDSSSFTES